MGSIQRNLLGVSDQKEGHVLLKLGCSFACYRIAPVCQGCYSGTGFHGNIATKPH